MFPDGRRFGGHPICSRQDIYPAIRAGGHNVAGLAMIDDGMVIDLSPMKQIQ